MIRLYGHSVGHASFAQVTRGMRTALAAHGALSGFVPVDTDDPGVYPDGFDARVSLNCGAPRAILKAHREGRHEKHWLLLAPNGRELPLGLAKWLTEPTEHAPRGYIDGLLAPSRWACEVLTKLFPGLPVVLAPHGVTPEVHHARANRTAGDRWRRGDWMVLHMTSTETERKGTKELLLAWARLMRKKELGKGAVLRIIGDPEHAGDLNWVAQDLGLDEGLSALNISVERGLTRSQEEVAALYRSVDLVVQPSRAEAFGLCSLEALCCGTPILATNGHGHGQWFVTGLPGAVAITNGKDAPMGDFEGSIAPTVNAEEIRLGLVDTFELYGQLLEAALDNARRLGQEWSWEKQNADAIEALVVSAGE